MSAALRIVAILREGDSSPGDSVLAKPANATAFERQQFEQRLRQLQAMCLLSPELERNQRTAQRHQRRGTYSRDVLIRAIERFVVEPAAIELTAVQHSAVQHNSVQPWFQTYPQALRTDLAERLAQVVEQQVMAVTGEHPHWFRSGESTCSPCR